MKVGAACVAVFSIGASIALLVDIRCPQASEIKIVSPSGYKDREGEGALGEDCCSPSRYQQVFPAEDFAALGKQTALACKHQRPAGSKPDESSYRSPSRQ